MGRQKCDNGLAECLSCVLFQETSLIVLFIRDDDNEMKSIVKSISIKLQMYDLCCIPMRRLTRRNAAEPQHGAQVGTSGLSLVLGCAEEQ